MIQYNTQNISFLKMHMILKDFGITNNAFFLELNDETLIDVNPLDEENLTKEQKVRIHNEISNNPWYFLREVLRIPTAGINRPFELTRGTLALSWALLNDFSSFVVLPRQCYKTYSICAVYTWLFYWGSKNSEFMLFSYADSILQGNLGRIKEIRDTLPSYLNLYDPRTDKDNSREMKFNPGDYYNHLRIKAPSKNAEDAAKVGRGFSSPMMWYDELNFIPQIGEIYDASVFAYKTVADIARQNGSHYHRIMSSSVGKLDDDSGVWGFNFLNNCCDFTERMYDYSKEEVQEQIKRNSTNNFLRIEYMYFDLSKPDTYLEEMRKDASTEEAFQREVLNKWQKVGGTHPLGKELVDLVSDYIDQPSDVLVIDNVYFLKLYRKVDEIDFNKRYICGVDCGGNLLRDFSTFVVVDPTNYEVVAVLRSNSYSTNRFAKCLVNILTNIFTNSILLPERNNMGIAIIDFILDNFPLLSSRIYKDMDDKPGFATTAKSRELLYNVLLRTAVANNYKVIHDRHIINEIIALTIGRNGRIDHPAGGHDDTLMAYLFTRWFFVYAKNISRYIDPTIIGSAINDPDKQIDQNLVEESKDNLLRTIRGSIDRRIYNNDGTINFDALNPMNMLNSKNENINTVESTVDMISEKLYSGNIKLERNIHKLEDDTILKNEEDNFDLEPEKIKVGVIEKDEKVKAKTDMPTLLTRFSPNDFKQILNL